MPVFDVFNPQWDIEEEFALDRAILELFKTENIHLGSLVHNGYSLVYFFKWELKNGKKKFQDLNLPNPYEVYMLYAERAGGTLSMHNVRVMQTGLGSGPKVGPLLGRQKPFTSLRKEELDFADSYCQQYPVKGLGRILDESWVWDV